jgi:hypothetical protein
MAEPRLRTTGERNPAPPPIIGRSPPFDATRRFGLTDCAPGFIATDQPACRCSVLRKAKTRYDANVVGWLLAQRKPNHIKDVYKIPRAAHFAHHGDTREGFDFLLGHPVRLAQANISEKLVPG